MKVQEFLRDPKNWCQRAWGVTRTGAMLSRNDVKAQLSNVTQCCLVGSLLKCYKIGSDELSRSFKFKRLQQAMASRLNKSADSITVGDVTAWNDDSRRRHAEVLQVAREAGI